MLKLRNTWAVLCAASLGLGASASAENLNLTEMGAALALPVITGEFKGNPLKDTEGADIFEEAGRVVTLATVTNGKDEEILLKVDVISGDVTEFDNPDDLDPSGDNWQSESFDCLLTANETTTFVFMPRKNERDNPPQSDEDDPGHSEVWVECSKDGDTEGDPKALFIEAQNGILFIAVADPESGDVVSEDVIFGDAIVVDYEEGQAASFGAIAFQAGTGLNDGNKIYAFDGDEYTKFPSVLATNFVAERPFEGDLSQGTYNETELILFTLDGTTGNIPTPRVRLTGFAYNDDEQMFDFSYEFDCFDIVQLNDINANFTFDPEKPSLGLGSWVGHLRLYPQPIAVGGPDAHDAQYGDGNGSRRRAVHGWIIGNFENDGLVVPEDNPIEGTPEIRLDDTSDHAAYGRPLNMSTTSIIPFMDDDDATLDADTRN